MSHCAKRREIKKCASNEPGGAEFQFYVSGSNLGIARTLPLVPMGSNTPGTCMAVRIQPDQDLASDRSSLLGCISRDKINY
jgi:hypothetical protein